MSLGTDQHQVERTSAACVAAALSDKLDSVSDASARLAAFLRPAAVQRRRRSFSVVSRVSISRLDAHVNIYQYVTRQTKP